MFTVDERNHVRDRLMAKAETDDDIVGAAFTGSLSAGTEDRWSDVDLVLAVRGDLHAAAERWTRWLYEQLNVQHHWDLAADLRIIRVFLLPGWLEIDLTFALEAEFGARGPQWRTIFGQAQLLEPFSAPDPGNLSGLLWHHALHARVCIERRRWLQAAHWIGALREHVITLACLRLGHPAGYAKGAHLLPDELAAVLETTLVCALTAPELHRALGATLTVVADELELSVPAVGARLRPMLAELPRPLSER